MGEDLHLSVGADDGEIWLVHPDGPRSSLGPAPTLVEVAAAAAALQAVVADPTVSSQGC